MREGGTLGFYLEHSYVDISRNLDKFSPSLKGGDAILYEVAKSLELDIDLCPVCDGKYILSDFGHET